MQKGWISVSKIVAKKGMISKSKNQQIDVYKFSLIDWFFPKNRPIHDSILYLKEIFHDKKVPFTLLSP